MVIYVKKDFYLLDALNEKIEILKAAGLIDFWHFQHVNKGILKAKNYLLPKVLKLGQLAGSFQILTFGCIVSCFIFICEVSIKIFTKNK